jgi:hypothetical protein
VWDERTAKLVLLPQLRARETIFVIVRVLECKGWRHHRWDVVALSLQRRVRGAFSGDSVSSPVHRTGRGALRDVGGRFRIANSARRPLAGQANLLLVEDANYVAADLHELAWVFFNLCQSTEVFKLVSSFLVHRRYPLVGIVRLPPQPEIVSVRKSLLVMVAAVNSIVLICLIVLWQPAPLLSRRNSRGIMHLRCI